MSDGGGLSRVGGVRQGPGAVEPFLVVGPDGAAVEVARAWVRDLVVGDRSDRTVRAYCFALLTWFRVLWRANIAWDRATEHETAAMVGWYRSAANPQRRRACAATQAGSVNLKTGKPSLGLGYAPATINLTLAAVHSFYAFYAYRGEGPVVNPVPASAQRRRALMHRSPLAEPPRFRRGPYRQKSLSTVPRSIPDHQWDELMAVLTCDRDRALFEAFVSTGARAAEMLGVCSEDLDWAAQRMWVVSKGSRVRRVVPLSPVALQWLGCYLGSVGMPAAPTSIWRARRGEQRSLTYAATRRVMQRANEVIATNWSLHDLRHTAAARMVGSGVLTIAEVQVILGHADLRSTTRYTMPRVEDVCAKLQDYYRSPASDTPRMPVEYDPADVAVIFGG